MLLSAVSVLSCLLLAVSAAPTLELRNNGGGSSSGSTGSGRSTGGSKRVYNVQVGPRPYFLVDQMTDSALKTKLQSCSEGPFKTTDFAFSHRGAPLMFPEHSMAGLKAAARLGAGVIECDVAFSSDKELVCRHDFCDLAYTTDILSRPELAGKCSVPFTPANGTSLATAKCCTTDITLAEFKTLCARMEGGTFDATNVSAPGYYGRIAKTPNWRPDLYSAAACARPYSFIEYIRSVDDLGLKFTPEAKVPNVVMPFKNMTQQMYIQKIVDELKSEGITADRVYLQSFKLDDVLYWVKNASDFGKQALLLDERADSDTNGTALANAVSSLASIKAQGVNIIAPSIWQLINVTSVASSPDGNSTLKLVPSSYAKEANRVGLSIMTWSFERSAPPLKSINSTYYYQSIREYINNDGVQMEVLDLLAQQVGVRGVFSDWSGTTVYYASCIPPKRAG